jgi:hypothetical protein
VLQTAVTTSGPELISYFLPSGWPGMKSDSWLKWIFVYWVELNSSTGNLTRDFNITLPALTGLPGSSALNGSFLSEDGYEYWDLPSVTATGDNATIILTKTQPSSPLGPILNAMEYFSKSDARNSRTDLQDGELFSIRELLCTMAIGLRGPLTNSL